MFRRIVIGLSVAVLVAALVGFLVVRQLVFGGTPTIHRSVSPTATVVCTPTSTTNGLQEFQINSQQSSASYAVQFQAAGQPLPGTVRGVTGDVSGQFAVAPQPNPTIQSLKIVVDLRTLDSGSSDRDDHVRNDSFEVDKYPLATFVASSAPILAGSYSEGQDVTFKLAGNLTLHGVTRPVTFDMGGKLSKDTITGTGMTIIHIQDFGMKQPQITSVITITIGKDVTLAINFVAQRTTCAPAS